MKKFYDGIMGLVVGDALGVPAEFKSRDTYKITDMTGYGTHNQPPGTWSDDSSMALATLESMVELKRVDPSDIMQRFSDWYYHGKYTPYGKVFDAGCAVSRAVSRFASGVEPMKCGGSGRMDNGNGALMRILPVAMVKGDVLSAAKLTHAHPISNFACLVYAEIVSGLMNDSDKESAVSAGIEKCQSDAASKEILEVYKRLPNIQNLNRDEIKSSGYVADTLEAALWCFLNTDNYRDCTLTAVNLGEDTDTVAAVAGGLAGIYYGCGGEKGIPENWIAQIPRLDWIKDLCANLSFDV